MLDVYLWGIFSLLRFCFDIEYKVLIKLTETNFPIFDEFLNFHTQFIVTRKVEHVSHSGYVGYHGDHLLIRIEFVFSEHSLDVIWNCVEIHLMYLFAKSLT